MIQLSKHIQETVPLAASLICAALAGIIWMPLGQDPKSFRMSDEPIEAPVGPDPSEVLSKGAQDLLARPLFHMSRRPPIVAVAPEATPVVVKLTLTGIVNSDDLQIALMRLSNRPELFRRQVGDSIGDWEIIDITESSVTVITPDGAQEVMSLVKKDQ